MRRQPQLARRFFDRFEPVHAVTYFAPEARAAFDGLGYRGFWMGYFAARSAPLGIVPREVVTAIFYNFAPERVAKALPAAWEIAGPEAALRARQDSAVAALRRYGIGTDENVSVAAELTGRAARQAPLDGRPLFAANLALPWPDDPLAALWHAATRMWRCWPPRGSRVESPTCYTPRRAGSRATTWRAPATTTTRRGVTRNDGWPTGGCSTTTGRLPRPAGN